MNAAAFFAVARVELFGGAMSQLQVDGCNAILRGAREYGLRDDETAYCLATAYHETARTMQPIREHGDRHYFFRMYDPNSPDPARARLAIQAGAMPGDGEVYYGRGYVQLTWRTNYRRLGALLKIDLEGSPDLALDPQIAAAVMFEGMRRGLFTGKSLADYFWGDTADFINARRIVNGLDKAHEIAGYARSFLKALQAARESAAPKQSQPPAPAPATQPTTEEKTVVAPAIIAAVLPSIIEAIPRLGRVFSSGSPTAERNVKAAEVAVSVVKEAIGAANEQEAAEMVKSDPVAREKADKAIEANWFLLTQQEAGGGGVGGARQFVAGAASNPEMWAIVRRVTYVALAFLAAANLIALVVWSVAMWRQLGVDSATQILVQVIAADILCASSAISFWLGSSFGSRTKDEAAAARAPG